MQREMIQIEIGQIVVKRPLRANLGNLDTLVNSIRTLGLLHPIILDQNNVLISGSRRVEACRQAGLTRVSAVRLNIRHDSMAALNIQSDENMCRDPLSVSDLENHIQAKKMNLPRTATALTRAKNVFSKIGGWFKRS